ncbi:MAG: hypothetical protein RMI32_03905 [Candidatus Nitrosocaldus sp.]|nr:hypothetical protein [Candidatus Nitrosocaldus sp.]
MQDNLKDRILDMLEKDKAFRNAIAGLIGYKEILERIARLDRKTSMRIARLEARLSERISKIEERISKIEERVSKIEERVSKIEARIAELDKKITEVEARLSERISKIEERISKIEARIAELDKSILELRSQVAGLSATLGMVVESEARRTLREYLMDQGYRLSDVRRRMTITVDGESIEIDIYGRVSRDGMEMNVIAEAKSRVSVMDIVSLVNKAMKVERIKGKSMKALLGFRIDDDAYDKAKELDVMLIQL